MRFKSDLKTTGTSDKIFFSAVCLVFFLISGSVLPFTRLSVLPDLLLCLCCILPKYMPRKECAVYAVSLGFLTDLLVGSPYQFSPVIYLLPCIFAPYFYSFFNRVGTVVAGVCSMPFLALRGLAGMIFLLAASKGVSFSFIFGEYIFPEFLVNFAFVLVVGVTVKYLVKLKKALF